MKESKHPIKKLNSRADSALSLGKSVRMLRNARARKSKSCAKEAEISAPALTLIEHSERQPSVETLTAIAKALNVPYDVFVIIEHPTMTGASEAVYAIVKAIKEVHKAEESLKRELAKAEQAR